MKLWVKMRYRQVDREREREGKENPIDTCGFNYYFLNNIYNKILINYYSIKILGFF